MSINASPVSAPPAERPPEQESYTPRIALLGSPNCGKTTLFNALTGLTQKIANYPGVTVDVAAGEYDLEQGKVTLLDLPGTYSLIPLSPDEQVTHNALNGKLLDHGAPEGVIIVADATTLPRALPFIGEALRLGLPSLVVLTMIDELKARGGGLKLGVLQRELGVKVIGVVGNKGLGMDDLKGELEDYQNWRVSDPDIAIPPDQARRFVWADGILEEALTEPSTERGWSDKVDKLLLHPVLGIVSFAVIMFLFFQIIFTVAAPLQDLMEGGVTQIGVLVAGLLSDGLFKSLLVDGLIAGVGGVVVFIPQIALLMLLIAILEGSGYMSRAAFVIDRVMGWAGLEGRCFIALLSSYACAIPGIMATRAVPDPQSRLATIMVAPFMTCSARLPVYALLIGAFIPQTTVAGIFSLQGIVLFALYLLGSFSALIAGWIFKRGLLKGKTYPFYMELPPYRMPSWRVVASYVWRGVKAFMKKAGGIILVASMLLWGMLTFPQVEAPEHLKDNPVAERSYQLEHSAAATVGKAIEPAIRPLGFDWKIGIGLVASLAAREVIVSTMAQIYSFEGNEEDIEGLGSRLQNATNEDGSKTYDLPTVLALMVFFVYALQCVSTLAIIRRETASWKWPVIAFTYMFVVAWVGAFITRHVAIWWLAA